MPGWPGVPGGSGLSWVKWQSTVLGDADVQSLLRVSAGPSAAWATSTPVNASTAVKIPACAAFPRVMSVSTPGRGRRRETMDIVRGPRGPSTSALVAKKALDLGRQLVAGGGLQRPGGLGIDLRFELADHGRVLGGLGHQLVETNTG